MAAHPAAESLRAGLHLSGLDTFDLWIAVFGLGGNLTLLDIKAILGDRLDPTALQYNVLSLALNECLDDAGVDHPVKTWDQLTDPGT